MVQPKGNNTKKSAYIYYAGVFLLNGTVGVLTTIYKRVDGENVSSIRYSLLIALMGTILTAVVLPFFMSEIKAITKPFHAVGFTVLNGLTSKIANLILTIALTVLPSSVQYPMVTGGVILVSTVIAVFTTKKPSRREYISVVLAFAGIMALILIPV